MNAHEMTVRCPVCSGPLEVVRTRCERCNIAIEGHFRMLEFNLLSADHLDLLRLFIKSRGNLKEMGRVVGVSYPTIRARFEELLAALGYEALPSQDTVAEERRAILDALENGEITPTEAASRFRKVGGASGGEGA